MEEVVESRRGTNGVHAQVSATRTINGTSILHGVPPEFNF